MNAAPSRPRCRQSFDGRSHFQPPAVQYSNQSKIIQDSFWVLGPLENAENNWRQECQMKNSFLQGEFEWHPATQGAKDPESGSEKSHNTTSWHIIWLPGCWNPKKTERCTTC